MRCMYIKFVQLLALVCLRVARVSTKIQAGGRGFTFVHQITPSVSLVYNQEIYQVKRNIQH